MLCFVVAVFGSVALAETEVYRINGTIKDAAGFYVQIDEDSKTYQKLGGLPNSDHFLYLYHLPKYPGNWNIGVRKNEEKVIRSLISASGRNDRPPRKGWKWTKTGNALALEVTKNPSLVFTLNETEANEGSATVDGGLICLNQDSDKWIMMKEGGTRRCDNNQDCKNGMDVIERENCTNDAFDSNATESNPYNAVTEDGNRILPGNDIHSDLGKPSSTKLDGFLHIV